MGTPDRTTDGSAPSVATPDSTAVRTRYQAPIRNLRPASPEVSAPSTAMHRAGPGYFPQPGGGSGRASGVPSHLLP